MSHAGTSPRVAGAAPWTALVVALVLVAGAGLASLFLGSRSVDPAVVSEVLLRIPGMFMGQDSGATADIETAVVLSRVPRTLTAILVGAALAVAGAGLQGVSRNPLGDPGLLGLNAGASAGIVIGLGWFGAATSWEMGAASLAGTLVAAALVFGLSQIGGTSPTPVGLTLSGAAVNAGFIALTSAIVLTHSDILDRFRYWNIGSVSRADAADLSAALPLIAVGLALVIFGSSGLNAMALGDDFAHGLGVDLRLQRLIVFLGVVLLAGSATAAAGPISFVGLLIPHAIRRLVGGDYRWIVVLSLLLGPALLLLADVIGRVIAPPQEVYVGIMTVVLGVPVLLVLLRRGKGVSL